MPGNLPGIPTSVIATWPAPNYEHPNPRRTWIVPFAGVMQGLMMVVVGTRVWLRLRKQAGQLGLDDLVLLPAFLAATMFTILVILANQRYGIDRHIWSVLHHIFTAEARLTADRDVPPQWFEETVLIAWLSELAFIIATCCNKVSILLFYRRLTHGTFSRRWKLATMGAIGFTLCYMLAFVLVLVFNCSPTESYCK